MGLGDQVVEVEGALGKAEPPDNKVVLARVLKILYDSFQFLDIFDDKSVKLLAVSDDDFFNDFTICHCNNL